MFVRKQVEATKADALKDGIKVPETVEEYCVKAPAKPSEDIDMLEFDEDYGEFYGDDSGIVFLRA